MSRLPPMPSRSLGNGLEKVEGFTTAGDAAVRVVERLALIHRLVAYRDGLTADSDRSLIADALDALSSDLERAA